MKIEEKMELIKLLIELNGLVIEKKLEGKEDKENLDRIKKIAKKLSEENVGNFDFSSDEKFEISLNDFLIDF